MSNWLCNYLVLYESRTHRDWDFSTSRCQNLTCWETHKIFFSEKSTFFWCGYNVSIWARFAHNFFFSFNPGLMCFSSDDRKKMNSQLANRTDMNTVKWIWMGWMNANDVLIWCINESDKTCPIGRLPIKNSKKYF